MQEDKINLIERLNYHVQNSYLKKKDVADRMGYSPSMITRVLTGERKVSPQFIEGFCAILSLKPHEKEELLKLAGLGTLIFKVEQQVSIFDSQSRYYHKQPMVEIATHLNEWKQIHSTVQSLLLAAELFVNAVERLAKFETEQDAYEVEHSWFNSCEAKRQRIIRTIRNLKVVRIDECDELLEMLQSEESIVEIIQQVNINNSISIRRLRGSAFALKELLVEVLDLSDFHIIQIADALLSLPNKSD